MSEPAPLYPDLKHARPHADRPYVFINMVTTVDGKTVSGDRTEDVLDLGSRIDHQVMRAIEDQADGVLVGASTLRAASPKWNPGTDFRVVASRRGDFNYEVPFFRGGGRAFVACGADTSFSTPAGVERLECGKEGMDPARLLKRLAEMGCRRLLCFGGSELNAQLLAKDLVDELFLTLAPKVKLGRGLPTYAGGEPLARERMLTFDLVEHHVVDSEVFLRYRRQNI